MHALTCRQTQAFNSPFVTRTYTRIHLHAHAHTYTYSRIDKAFEEGRSDMGRQGMY